jgi:hypothetical protein
MLVEEGELCTLSSECATSPELDSLNLSIFHHDSAIIILVHRTHQFFTMYFGIHYSFLSIECTFVQCEK